MPPHDSSNDNHVHHNRAIWITAYGAGNILNDNVAAVFNIWPGNIDVNNLIANASVRKRADPARREASPARSARARDARRGGMARLELRERRRERRGGFESPRIDAFPRGS